jgi:hypothetical protein
VLLKRRRVSGSPPPQSASIIRRGHDEARIAVFALADRIVMLEYSPIVRDSASLQGASEQSRSDPIGRAHNHTPMRCYQRRTRAPISVDTAATPPIASPYQVT